MNGFPLTVLVVEDDRHSREIVQAMLSARYGYQVHASESGAAALALLEKIDYGVDAILLDYQMPKMNGIEFFENLLKTQGKNTPVVMLTATDTLELAIEFMKMGGVDFIRKPVLDYDLLDLTLQRAIKFAANKSELQKAEAALIAAENARDFMEDFIAKVSHELGTPSHHISSALHLVRKAVIECNTEKALDWIDTAETSNNRLKRLVKDIFDLSALQRGKFSIRHGTSNLNNIVTTAVSEVSSLPSGFAGEFKTDTQDITISCDEDRVTQVFVNLINNSVRYAPESETIDIKIEANNNKAICSVSDHGPGIPEAQRENIFKSFFQNSDGYNQSGTLGLGLAISREIVRQHGGALTVEPNTPKGTTFVFTLPLSTEGDTHERHFSE